MNKSIILLITALLLMQVSCRKEPGDEYKPLIDFKTDKKALQLIEADNLFAFDLMKEVDVLAEEDNYMISPLSVSIALGMTYNGSEGLTRSAFEETLRLSGLSRHEINYIHGALIKHLLKVDRKVTFEVANSIWVKHLYTIVKEFADTNIYYYDAEIRSVDFLDPETKDIINGWIEDKTRGKVKDVIDVIPPDVVMYLINALYFNGDWKYKFEEDTGFQIDFRFADESSGKVDAMKLEGDLEVFINGDVTAIDLPYGNNKYSMVLLLPDESKTVEDLVDILDIEQWNEWLSGLDTLGINLQMPKFKYEYKTLLNDPLTAMGLGVAFTGAAEFPYLVEETNDLFISRVIHQTFIDVNEKGTEAAAVTVVEIRETSVPEEPPLLKLDRPFLYVIREKTSNAIVFMGKVGRPVY